MKPRVLCVDDEPRLLKGISRRLGREMDLTLAESGPAALAALRSSPPFQVIVSDMKMPGMSGAQLLATVRAEFPDVIRVLLTGHSDLDDAVSAVNDGGIFRFLLKPCPPEILSGAIVEAYEQNRLIRSERELLEGTVRGSVALLAEILAIRDPAAADRGTRLRHQVSRIARKLGVTSYWDIEVAAMLCEIGYALIPNEIVDRWRNGLRLSPQEQALIDKQPSVARELVANIPRLDGVGEILGGLAPGAGRVGSTRVATAVAIIQAARAYDELLRTGMREGVAIQKLRAGDSGIPADILDALEALAVAAGGYVTKQLRVSELISGLRLAEDLMTTDGRLLLTAGAELTEAARTRVQQYSEHVGIREPIRVRVPA